MSSLSPFLFFFFNNYRERKLGRKRTEGVSHWGIIHAGIDGNGNGLNEFDNDDDEDDMPIEQFLMDDGV